MPPNFSTARKKRKKKKGGEGKPPPQVSLSNLCFTPEGLCVPVLSSHPVMRAGESVNSQQLSQPPSQSVSTCQLVFAGLTETVLTPSLSAYGRKTLFLTWTLQHVIKLFLESFIQSEVLCPVKYCGRTTLNSISLPFVLDVSPVHWLNSSLCLH